MSTYFFIDNNRYIIFIDAEGNIDFFLNTKENLKVGEAKSL